MDDDDLMIIGAKKTVERNYDKNDLSTCVTNFNKFIIQDKLESSKENFVHMCYAGEVDKNFIRPSLWKIFLGLLPFGSSLSSWREKTKKLRVEYKNKLKGLNTLKKFSGDPLGNSKDAEWSSFFEENELRKIINLDVNRTYQDKELFQSMKIKEILVNILFLWSKENKEISYKQGMNEILAVLLYSFYPFYFPNKLSQGEENKESYLFFHDQDELQADLFYIFEAVMNKGIKDLFDTSTFKSTKDLVNYKKYELFNQQWTEDGDTTDINLPALNRRCNLIIKEKLRLVDEELHNHFIKIDLNCTIFLQRWLKCIFNREFHPKDVLILWDAIIASDLIDSVNMPNESYSFMLMDFIAVAMINYIREDLLRKDQNDCFQRLFKYPPIETPVILIKLANQIKNLLFNKKRKRDEKLKNGNLTKSSKPTQSINGTNKPEETSKSFKEIETKSSPLRPKPKEIVSPKKEQIVIMEDDPNVELVDRLGDIFKKYNKFFEPDDKSDFEMIIQTLKNNLNNI